MTNQNDSWCLVPLLGTFYQSACAQFLGPLFTDWTHGVIRCCQYRLWPITWIWWRWFLIFSMGHPSWGIYRDHVSFFGGFWSNSMIQLMDCWSQTKRWELPKVRVNSLPRGHLENFDSSHGHWGDQEPGTSGRRVENRCFYSPSWWYLLQSHHPNVKHLHCMVLCRNLPLVFTMDVRGAQKKRGWDYSRFGHSVLVLDPLCWFLCLPVALRIPTFIHFLKILKLDAPRTKASVSLVLSRE